MTIHSSILTGKPLDRGAFGGLRTMGLQTADTTQRLNKSSTQMKSSGFSKFFFHYNSKVTSYVPLCLICGIRMKFELASQL